ncbi:MAG: hypothetical protein RIR26_1820 [Pseudomonadota bacterium]|jgi:lipopolysaccharide/colanic/teichoic acid biosynthesis glycosyltransferase
MSPQIALRKPVVILASGAEKFIELSLLSEMYTRRAGQLLPISCSADVQAVLKEKKKILVVFDRNHKMSSHEENLICDALSRGAGWMSLSVFQGLLSGHAHIERIDDLLDWFHLKEEGIRLKLAAGMSCLLRRLIALVALTFSLPLFLVIAIGIKATSRGPVFFSQRRVGHRGKDFKILKFRTMRMDAESDGPQWCRGDNDVRIFPFGRFLRKSHLDELPQLWNVVKGDLCFIGPRPERPEFHDTLKPHIPHFHVRVTVRPGITGWAQLRAGYASSIEDARKKVAHDIYFMRTAGLWLSCRIMIQTIGRVVSGVIESLFAWCRKGRFFLRKEGDEV